MIFSRLQPPPGFYVYLYLREDGTPYYVGKGIRQRAWSKNHNVRVPKDHSRIIITHFDLTEMWSLAMERWFIRWYGRKDNGTGILRNLTDGGEGAPNLNEQSKKKHKENTKIGMRKPGVYEKLCASQKRAHNTKDAKERNSAAQKIAQNRQDVVEKKRIASLIAQNRDDVKSKKSGKNHYRYDTTIFTFSHIDGRIENLPAHDFAGKYNLDRGWLSNVIRGVRKTIKGWRVLLN